MKKVLLIVGIVILLLCVLSFLSAGLNAYGYRHVLDGSPSLYDRLHRRMIVFSISGIVLAVIGAGCMIGQTKL